MIVPFPSNSKMRFEISASRTILEKKIYDRLALTTRFTECMKSGSARVPPDQLVQETKAFFTAMRAIIRLQKKYIKRFSIMPDNTPLKKIGKNIHFSPQFSMFNIFICVF